MTAITYQNIIMHIVQKKKAARFQAKWPLNSSKLQLPTIKRR